jgi:multidrug efflux pump subunit AcrA (membrane-fusion protein)
MVKRGHVSKGIHMDHQGNHRQFQSAIVPSLSQSATFSNNGSLPRSQIPSISDWTLGPGPIKPPVLILPDASTKRATATPTPRRLRSSILIPPEPERKTTKSKAIWTMLSILTVLGVIVGVTWMNTKAAADVMLFQVNQAHATPYINGSGIVFPRQRFDLSSPETDQVQEVLVKAGDQVMPDQALIRLSHHGLLVSPIRGTVTAVNINAGEIFAANALLLTVMDETSAIIHAQLPLTMFGQVTTGSKAEVTASTWPGKAFQGTVSSIIPQADAQTDTFEVWIDINSQKEVLLPGMKVSVRIPAAQPGAHFSSGDEA